jgi:hypothetical protein
MTIFRFSAVIGLAMLAGGCAKNMPAADTELGRIARIGDVKQTESELAAYARQRLNNRTELQASLLRAGFSRAANQGCEIYRWDGKNWGSTFSKSMVVSICRNRVEASAGYLAP